MDIISTDGSFVLKRADGTVVANFDGSFILEPRGKGILIRPGDANAPGSVRVAPRGDTSQSSTGGYVQSQFRAYTTENTDPAVGPIESIDLESHFDKVDDSGIRYNQRYSLKTREENGGAHYPFVVQIGGHDALAITTDGAVGINVAFPHQAFQVNGRVRGGTGTITTSGTAITGTGTAFLTQLRVDDALIPATICAPRRVVAITSDTEATIDAAFDGPDLVDVGFSFSHPVAYITDDGIIAASGDVIVDGAGNGALFKTPNGQHGYRLSVDNAGGLVTTLLW